MLVTVARLLVVALPLVSTASTAFAYCRSTTVKPARGEVCTDAGVPLQWYDRCADVKLFPRAKAGLTTNQIRDVLQRSFDTWKAVTCEGEPVGLEADVSIAETPTNAAWESVAYFVDDADDWRDRMNEDDAVAVTLVSFGVRSGRLHAADIEINDWNFNLGICGATCPPGLTDLENALTHEAGHFYGLGYMPVGSPPTMEEWAVAGESRKRTLGPDEIAGICAVYPPGTFPEACTGSTFYPDEGGCGCTTIGARGAQGRARGCIAGVLSVVLALCFRKRTRA